jgi:hypothetical protein
MIGNEVIDLHLNCLLESFTCDGNLKTNSDNVGNLLSILYLLNHTTTSLYPHLVNWENFPHKRSSTNVKSCPFPI